MLQVLPYVYVTSKIWKVVMVPLMFYDSGVAKFLAPLRDPLKFRFFQIRKIVSVPFKNPADFWGPASKPQPLSYTSNNF